jgi:hypothetical protein
VRIVLGVSDFRGAPCARQFACLTADATNARLRCTVEPVLVHRQQPAS